MIIEQRCPSCTTNASPRGAALPESSPPGGTRGLAGGALTFRCRCGEVATVPTASGPGRELARRGWTFQFLPD